MAWTMSSPTIPMTPALPCLFSATRQVLAFMHNSHPCISFLQAVLHACSHGLASGCRFAAALLGYSILLANIQMAGPQMGWWPEHISVSATAPVSTIHYRFHPRKTQIKSVLCCYRQVIQRRNLLPPLERVRRLKAMSAACTIEGALLCPPSKTEDCHGPELLLAFNG